MAWCQVGLGVATLLNYVPVHLGSAHQAGALTLMSFTLAALYCTKPSAGAFATANRVAARLGRATAPTTAGGKP